ncbi:GTPase Era [Parachryseolinea silvisoli]|jgi:GTP-binding protein Era|uniref:GTPase Era n=1 Tax=Parachryseolinea silvisoli TaxID=2873601 RepID=UPI002265D57C|nr:GTPase Era [Parachryseolinea silvisoli]MCD9016046.1 GTPase Era [Parachryseolinea silvisoli]
MAESSNFKAGFVSIVGKPNVGKSSLMNKLMGENLSIITAKAQTTRHRIMGILNGADFQVVYSDTPGILEPKYSLHEAMMSYVKVSLEDADAILLVVAIEDVYEPELFERFLHIKTPILLVLNKIDLAKGSQVDDKVAYWKSSLPNLREIVTVSAQTGKQVDTLLPKLLSLMPEHPAYFPQDEYTDRTERFFAQEIIREKIFLNYEQEIPYSTEVSVTSFKEEPDIIRIAATIYVERDSQKGIIIGKAGSSLKKVGMQARKDMESFFAKKIFLETHVKVADNWRKEKFKLRQFGYLE